MQKETFQSLWSSPLITRPKRFVFLSTLFPLRDPATTILPQQLRLESSVSPDLSLSHIPKNYTTTKSAASAQIHPTGVSSPPSCFLSAHLCLRIGLPNDSVGLFLNPDTLTTNSVPGKVLYPFYVSLSSPIK